MRTLLWIAAAAVSLTACATGSSDVCPTLYAYDVKTQAQAAAELDALPEGAALPRMMGDYAAVRAEIRACMGR